MSAWATPKESEDFEQIIDFAKNILQTSTKNIIWGKWFGVKSLILLSTSFEHAPNNIIWGKWFWANHNLQSDRRTFINARYLLICAMSLLICPEVGPLLILGF